MRGLFKSRALHEGMKKRVCCGPAIGGGLSSRGAGHGSRAGRGMRRSLVISGTAHAVLLVWGVIAFVARPNEAPHGDFHLMIEVKDLAQLDRAFDHVAET
jgi:hypothetical protein